MKRNIFIKKFIDFIASESVMINMKKIYHLGEVEKKLTDFYFQKIKLSFCVLMIGVFIGFVIYEFPNNTAEIINNVYIRRNIQGEGDKVIYADMYCEDQDSPREVSITVSEQRLSNEEIDAMTSKFKNDLYMTIIGNNNSPNNITEDLNFINELPGYPFTLSYHTDNPVVLDNKGHINEEKLREKDVNNEGILISITVSMEYYDYTEDFYFGVRINQKELAEEELFAASIDKSLAESDEKSLNESVMKLPSSIEGKHVWFKEKTDDTYLVVILLSAIMALVIFFGKDEEIKSYVEKRNKQMIDDYPSIVNKFALFYNAGMPVKNIWNAICTEYLKQSEITGERKYVYEEMVISNAFMQEGKGEIEAYESFSERVNLTCYRNFINILQQAVVKGKKDVGLILIKESEAAFLNRKLRAKKLSEEASTKMLIPMFMMLVVVIAMVVFPAFYSFKVS